MTIKLNSGTITASLDEAKSPCAVASFSFLAGIKFFDGTTCSDLDTAGPYVLECGDPSGKGDGGPSYTFPDENLPTDFAPAPVPTPSPSAGTTPSVIYPAGTLAMASSIDQSTGQVTPDSGGSQFLIVYKDSALPPNFSVFGKITGGLDVVQKVAAAGVASLRRQGADLGQPPKHSVIVDLGDRRPDRRHSDVGSPRPDAEHARVQQILTSPPTCHIRCKEIHRDVPQGAPARGGAGPARTRDGRRARPTRNSGGTRRNYAFLGALAVVVVVGLIAAHRERGGRQVAEADGGGRGRAGDVQVGAEPGTGGLTVARRLAYADRARRPGPGQDAARRRRRICRIRAPVTW